SCLVSFYYTGYDALQVSRFRHIEQDRVVLRLTTFLENTHVAACIGCGGAQHPQGAEVEFLVAAQSGRHCALGFGEGGRVEDDGVVLASGGGVVLEQVKGVRLDPFDLANAVLGTVELLVPLGDFQRRTRRVNRGHARAHSCEMQGEASLISEAIERLTVSIPGSGSVVFALIEESASLLSGESVEVKTHAVHGEDGARPIAAYQLRFARRQLLQFADVRINPLEHAGLRKMLGHRIENNRPQVLAVEGLRERLHREHVVVLVEDEPGQQIALAEDHTVGIRVTRDLPAKLDCAGDALAQQRWELRCGDFFAAQQTDGDLRCAAVESRTQTAPALVAHMDNCSTWNIYRRHEIGAVNPQMSAPQPGCATVISGYDWDGCRQSILCEIKDLSYAGGGGRARAG